MRNVLRNEVRLSEQDSQKIGEEFIKHESLIERLVHKHITKYGGDYDSLYARAVDKLIISCRTHDPLRQEWSKFLAVQITYGLLDHMLEIVRRKSQVHTNTDELFECVMVQGEDIHDEDYISYLRQELSPDAEFVLNYLLSPTETAITHKVAIRQLRKKTRAMGWSRRRTETALAELKCMILADG